MRSCSASSLFFHGLREVGAVLRLSLYRGRRQLERCDNHHENSCSLFFNGVQSFVVAHERAFKLLSFNDHYAINASPSRLLLEIHHLRKLIVLPRFNSALDPQQDCRLPLVKLAHPVVHVQAVRELFGIAPLNCFSEILYCSTLAVIQLLHQNALTTRSWCSRVCWKPGSSSRYDSSARLVATRS